MKPRINHQFVLELYRRDAETEIEGGQRCLEDVDWEPAVEAAFFDEMRRSSAPPSGERAIEPVWCAEGGRPHVDGVAVTFSGVRRGGVLSAVTFFSAAAKSFASEMVEDGRLEKGDLYHYRVAAYPHEGDEGGPAAGDEFERVEVSPPFSEGVSLAAAAGDSAIVMDSGHAKPGDFPVYLPGGSVIDEATALTAEVEGVETGGILIGNLHRDEASGDLGMVITAQIPATETRRELNSLTFTASTWAAVGGALKLRGGSEAILGWWHSHPAKNWCNAECPPERRAECPLQKSFFSEPDKNLHRTVFPKAWSVGLLITNGDAGMKYSMWGWRDGTIQRRSFSILGRAGETLSAPAPL